MIDQAVREVAPRPSVELVVRAGPAAEVLVQESAGAGVLVLGHRGRGAMASALLGSVGLHCLLRAGCPVTVVRPPAPVATGA